MEAISQQVEGELKPHGRIESNTLCLPQKICEKIGEYSKAAATTGLKGAVTLVSPCFTKSELLSIYKEAFDQYPELRPTVELCCELCPKEEDQLILFAILFHALAGVKDKENLPLKMMGVLMSQMGAEKPEFPSGQEHFQQVKGQVQFIVQKAAEGFAEVAIENESVKKVIVESFPEAFAHLFSIIITPSADKPAQEALFSLPLSKQCVHMSSKAASTIWGFVTTYLPKIGDLKWLTSMDAFSKVAGTFYSLLWSKEKLTIEQSKLVPPMLILLAANRIAFERPEDGVWKEVCEACNQRLSKGAIVQGEQTGGGDRRQMGISWLKDSLKHDGGEELLGAMGAQEYAGLTQALKQCANGESEEFQQFWKLIEVQFFRLMASAEGAIEGSQTQQALPIKELEVANQIMRSTGRLKNRNPKQLAEKALLKAFPKGAEGLPFASELQYPLWVVLREKMIPSLIEDLVKKIETPEFRLKYSLQLIQSVHEIEQQPGIPTDQALKEAVHSILKKRVQEQIHDVQKKVDASIDSCLGKYSPQVRKQARCIASLLMLSQILEILLKPVHILKDYTVSRFADRQGSHLIAKITNEELNEMGYEILNHYLDHLSLRTIGNIKNI